MRAFATHDETGTIIRLVVGPTDGLAAGVVPLPSQRIAEVDIPDLELDLTDPTLQTRLLDVIAQYQVERAEGTGLPTLTPRNAPSLR